MDEKLLFYAGLSSNDLIGPKRFERLLANCGSVERFFSLSIDEQMQCVGVSFRQRELFEAMLVRGKEIIRLCQNEGIDLISFEDTRFPRLLRDIPDPPFLLYVAGKLLPEFPLVGVVGTRRATPEALEINRFFCRELVKYGIGIVSGLAQGHDEMAHRTVLEYGGYTIAVLGTSFHKVANHRKGILNSIREQGAIVSEYPPLAINHKWRFRFRNRLIAGFSRAVLVIQAPEKSGTLITAEYAQIQGKPLFFIPGNPLDPSYKGSNMLTKQGGTMVTIPEDILSVVYERIPQRSSINANNLLPLLSETENQFFSQLPVQFSLDSLLETTEKPIGELITFLTQLEMKGYLIQFPGNIYEKRL